MFLLASGCVKAVCWPDCWSRSVFSELSLCFLPSRRSQHHRGPAEEGRFDLPVGVHCTCCRPHRWHSQLHLYVSCCHISSSLSSRNTSSSCKACSTPTTGSSNGESHAVPLCNNVPSLCLSVCPSATCVSPLPSVRGERQTCSHGGCSVALCSCSLHFINLDIAQAAPIKRGRSCRPLVAADRKGDAPANRCECFIGKLLSTEPFSKSRGLAPLHSQTVQPDKRLSSPI